MIVAYLLIAFYGLRTCPYFILNLLILLSRNDICICFVLCFCVLDITCNGLQNLVSLGTPNPFNETSSYTSHELIVTLRKSGCHFGKEDDRLNIVPCREDKPICCDESSDPEDTFCFLYATIFKKVLLCLPFVEPSGIQALKNPNPLKDVEGLDVLVVAELS